MAYTGNKNVAAAKTKKEEADDTSNRYMYTTRRNSTVLNGICSSYIINSRSEYYVSSNEAYIGKTTGNQTYKNDVNEYNGTEICAECLRKRDNKNQATHFCKTCDTYGRYICNTCLVDHNPWTGKNHDVVSLSVDRKT